MALFRLWILSLSAVFYHTYGDSILDCCKEKTVGGVEYQLKGLADTKQFGCRNSCTFQRKDDPSTTFCFAQGDSAASCNDEEGSMIELKTLSMPQEYKEKLSKQIQILENCFENKAVAGKVAVGDILDVTNAADIKLREAGLRPNTTMNFQDDLQGVVDKFEGEDFVDWSQFGSLILQARGVYYESLLKSLLEKLELSETKKITTADIEGIKEMLMKEGNEELANHVGHVSSILFSNFDQNDDGTVQIADFIYALKNAKF